jgi:hypothetical protein
MSEQLNAFQAAIEADAVLQKKKVKAASDAAEISEEDLARLSGGSWTWRKPTHDSFDRRIVSV